MRRDIDEIDRELSALATVHADIRRRGGEVAPLATDELLDERLRLNGTVDDPPTEEFVQVQFPDPTAAALIERNDR